MDRLSCTNVSLGQSDNSTRGRRRWRRVAALTTLAVTPVLALAWAGCGDDDEAANAALSIVDPGGTWGAEVTITIQGRGRVTSVTPGIDCPSNCFTKYVFPSNTADGAAGGLTLKAHVTPGTRFKGWTADVAPRGTRGRGGEKCNPVMRAGQSVSGSTDEITLPYGEVQGTAPAGQEGACAGTTTVPFVYNLTATFETDGDGLDGGSDGGTLPDTVYTAVSGGTSAADVGLREDGYLFWRYTSSTGTQGLAYGSSPSGSLSQTPNTAGTFSSIQLFDVKPHGVVFQSGSTNYVVPYGYLSARALSSPGTCYALAVEATTINPSVFCRTSSAIYVWRYSTGLADYSSPTLLYSGTPFGQDLAADGSYVYFSDGSTLYRAPNILPDSGAITTLTTAVSGSSSTYLDLFGSSPTSTIGGVVWLRSSGSVFTLPSKSITLQTPSDTTIPPSSGNRFFARDFLSSSNVWVANASSIWLASSSGGSLQTFRTGLSGIQGMTADSQYVYTAQSDGTIRRAARSSN